MIPKIIHQTWKNENISPQLSDLAETWRVNHPEWEYKFWTDEANRDFIATYYPQFLSVYDSYPYPIQRVDAVRYYILFKMGGVFIDLDFECIKNIDGLLDGKKCVLGVEPDEHCKRFNKEKILCNAFMACTPRNPFFGEICAELMDQGNRRDTAQAPWRQILETTGPFKLTRIFDNYKYKLNIDVLPAHILYPLNLHETRALFSDTLNVTDQLQDKINNAYAVHYFLGSWLPKL